MNAPKVVLLAVEGGANCIEFLLAEFEFIDCFSHQAVSDVEVLFLCLQRKLLLRVLSLCRSAFNFSRSLLAAARSFSKTLA